jgi:hypothetical protein
MNRTLISRIAKLEADRRPTKTKDRGVVVLQGNADGDDDGQIEALIRHGDVEPDDTFVILRSVGGTKPRYSTFKPYRRFKNELHHLPLEHLQ